METLYAIATSIRKIEDLCDDATELQTYLDSVNMQLKDKAENVLKYERHLETQSIAIDSEIKRLQELKRMVDNRTENIKNYVKYTMEVNDIKKIETTIGNFSLRKTESVEILCEVPNKYMKIKVTKTPDKIAIKEALKKGKEIKGAILKTYNSLIIK